MKLFSATEKFEKNYFSCLIALLPISFIAGNLIINANIIILILSAVLLYRSQLFSIKYFHIDKLLFIYFALIIFTGIYNDIEIRQANVGYSDFVGSYHTSIKSFLFLKYLFLYLVIRFLIQNDVLNLKIFFIICSLSSLFVCFDIFFQFIYGKDIFGYGSSLSGRKLGGPFGDELIAGGYIQRFSLFTFFAIPLFFRDTLINKYKNFIVPILLSIFLVGIILSGNRMPFILYLILLSLVVLFQQQTRKFFFPFIILFSLIFLFAFNFNSKVKNNFINFYAQINKMQTVLKTNNFESKTTPLYLKEFHSFYDTWLMNKYFGGGLKNFRYYCHVRDNIDKDTKFKCNMHPHNYYLEILTETGMLGFFIVISIIFLVLYVSFYKKYFSKSAYQENNIIIPFIFLFMIEIFPFKSTGSFFTTGNTTYLFLILSILVGLAKKDISIENKF